MELISLLTDAPIRINPCLYLTGEICLVLFILLLDLGSIVLVTIEVSGVVTDE
jgi:hypothetical protein